MADVVDPPPDGSRWTRRYAFELAGQAAVRLAGLSGGVDHDVALVLGTGLAAAADGLGIVRWRHPLGSMPGFPQSFVSHQRSEVWSVEVGDRRVLVFLGRLHLYEGYGPARVAHAVRTAVAAGCGTVVLTNAAGSLRAEVPPGELVLICDHLNLTGRSPMDGLPTGGDRPTGFVDLVDAWSPRLRALARSVDGSLGEGVYAQVPGPHFETPAEIRMLRTLGADLVGMSSVLEAIAARQLGAEVLGLSLVTNLAAGMEASGVSPTEIIELGHRRAGDVGRLVREIVLAL
jgi:purine-nucleoside phosphorylase